MSSSWIQQALDSLSTTLSSKNEDYRVDDGEFSNFEYAANVADSTPVDVMMTQIGIKLGRLKGLADSPNNEARLDTFKDLAGYAVIMYAYALSQGKPAEIGEEAPEPTPAPVGTWLSPTRTPCEILWEHDDGLIAQHPNDGAYALVWRDNGREAIRWFDHLDKAAEFAHDRIGPNDPASSRLDLMVASQRPTPPRVGEPWRYEIFDRDCVVIWRHGSAFIARSDRPSIEPIYCLVTEFGGHSQGVAWDERLDSFREDVARLIGTSPLLLAQLNQAIIKEYASE